MDTLHSVGMGYSARNIPHHSVILGGGGRMLASRVHEGLHQSGVEAANLPRLGRCDSITAAGAHRYASFMELGFTTAVRASGHCSIAQADYISTY